MSIELVTIIVLLIMFVIGSVLSINLGILGFVAAFLVGTLASGMSVDDIYSVFPADLFVTLAGVTYLFAVVQNNGTVDLLTSWGLRLVRGNLGLIPWVMFALSTLLTCVGTLAPATVAIVAPIGLRFAARYQISSLMMGILIVMGTIAGSFSMLNPWGVIVNGVMQSKDLPHSPGWLFLNAFIFSTIVSMVVYIVFGGLRLLLRKDNAQAYAAATAEVNPPDNKIEKHTEEERERLTLYKGVTLAGIGLLVVAVLVFDVDIGFAAFSVGLALALIAPRKQSEVLKRIPWSVILLVTGIATYVGFMEKVGAVDYLTELIAKVGDPVIAALAASYVGGIISAFASTTGFLAGIIPLVAPILQDPSVSSIGVISAIAIASSIVDISPFSTSGALLLANVQGVKERVFYRQLLIVAAITVALGPGIAWLAFVLI